MSRRKKAVTVGATDATDTDNASSNNDTGSETGSDTGSSGGDGSSDKSNLKSRVKEVPIDNYKDALDFANREWNKIKRENGHTLECQVQGSCKWKVGEWCKVYMPSFDIDDYMYIVRVSQTSEGGEWSTNLSLADYPPGWGKEELTNNSEEEENSDETDGTDTDTDTGDSGSDSSDGATDGTDE